MIVEKRDVSTKAAEFNVREELILQCALDLFLEHGEEKVTVEMIADKASIGKGTVYKHFETKSEIFALLMIQYEKETAEIFQRINGDIENPAALARDYFKFRLSNPGKYALFDRLEAVCVKEGKVDELLVELHRIRSSNLDQIMGIINLRISEGRLVDVPPAYHLGAAWAFVHGVVALYHSEFYKALFDGDEAFLDYLMEVLLRLGNKDKLGAVTEKGLELTR